MNPNVPPTPVSNPQLSQLAPVDVRPKRQIVKPLLWIILGIININALVEVVFLVLFIQASISHPNPVEIALIGLVPMTGASVIAACVVDAGCLIAYLFSHKEKSRAKMISASAGLAIIMGILGLVIFYFISAEQQAKTAEKSQHRLIGKDEFISLIQSCGVSSFTLSNDKIYITYNYTHAGNVEKGDPTFWPFYADGTYWNNYTAAADAVALKCGIINYYPANTNSSGTNNSKNTSTTSGNSSKATTTNTQSSIITNCAATSNGPWTITRQQIFLGFSPYTRMVEFTSSPNSSITKLPYCVNFSYVNSDFTSQLGFNSEFTSSVPEGSKVDIWSSNGIVYYIQSSLPEDTRPIHDTSPSLLFPASQNVCTSGVIPITISNVHVTTIDVSQKSIAYTDPATGKTKTIQWCGSSAFVNGKGSQIPFGMLNANALVDIYTQNGFVYGITIK